MRSVSRLAAPDATVATWSVAAQVRAGLERTGFAVEKRAGFGHKKEMLIARNTKQSNLFPERKNRNAMVIGAGLAGAAVCERLCARGWDVELVERHAEPAQEASGNPAGAFHPVVTPDDSVFARLTRVGFLHSLNRWKVLENLRWDQCGLLTSRARARGGFAMRRSMDCRTCASGGRRDAPPAGVPVSAGGVWFPEASWIDPPSLVGLSWSVRAKLKRTRERTENNCPNRTVISPFVRRTEAARGATRLRRVRVSSPVPADQFEPPRRRRSGGMVLPARRRVRGRRQLRHRRRRPRAARRSTRGSLELARCFAAESKFAGARRLPLGDARTGCGDAARSARTSMAPSLTARGASSGRR
jgi:hypothetical protein